jgi:hypothetical protein
MTVDKIIEQAKRILALSVNSIFAFPEAVEFLRVYAGDKSAFYKQLSNVNPNASLNVLQLHTRSTLGGFINYIENGLAEGLSIERKAQIDVVSDFLAQAQQLLETKNVHPAAPCVIIGAALEEFLRNWVEASSLNLGNNKPSLDAYSRILKEAELLTKQDVKDLTAWGGLRNHAAHGEWEEVSERKRVQLMLEGVNLFMRKYGAA